MADRLAGDSLVPNELVRPLGVSPGAATECESRPVAGCCDPQGYDDVFDERFARRTGDRYRSRGLDRTAQRIVETVAGRGIDGATVLEIGGGVGAIHVELLKRGASRATNLELSSSYDAAAQRLLDDIGLSGRVERRIVDIAAAPDEVEAADVVVLHRVVCCYPDHARLLGAAAQHARRQLVFSHPPRNLLSRTAFGAENLGNRLRGMSFRVFAHEPAAMRHVVESEGMRTEELTSTFTWRLVAAVR